MTKKTISASNKINIGTNDIDSDDEKIKYICEFSNHHFVYFDLDENGKKKYHTDANGNNKLPDIIEDNFIPVSGHKNADGKVDPNTAFCFYVVDRKKHKEDFDSIVSTLDKKCANPIYKMYREDDHFKKRNPEAFRIASEKSEMEQKLADSAAALSEKDKEIEDLKAQLFSKKKA